MSDEHDFYNAELRCMLRPTPLLMFRTVSVPQPHLGENVGASMRILHQKFIDLNRDTSVWLPVETEGEA